MDRNSATYHSVTVDDFTVVITEFKPKVKKEKKAANVTANNNHNEAGSNNKNSNGEGPSSNKSMMTKKLDNSVDSPVKRDPGELSHGAPHPHFPLLPTAATNASRPPTVENGQPKAEVPSAAPPSASSPPNITVTTSSNSS